MRCGSRLGQNVRRSDDAVCLHRGGWGWRRSGAAAAAQLAFVVGAASLLDEWSSNDHPGEPHQRNRDKEREGNACAPAPGNRHRDPHREHRGDDHSTPRHDPWKSVLHRCVSPVESQTLEASGESDADATQPADRRRGTSRPRFAGRVAECGKYDTCAQPGRQQPIPAKVDQRNELPRSARIRTATGSPVPRMANSPF
jgi:hypothetical protein